MIRAAGKLRRHAGASPALVQVAAAGGVVEILDEAAVIETPWLVAGPRPPALFQVIAAAEFHDGAGGVGRVAVAPGGVDGEAVGSPADERHLLLAAGEPLQERDGNAVVMVGAVGLHVGVVGIEAERERAAEGVVVPAGVAVVVPHLGGAGIEQHAIDRDAEGLAAQRHRPGGGHGLRRHREAVALRADAVRVIRVGEAASGVIGQAIRGDDALVARDGDRHLVATRRRLGGGHPGDVHLLGRVVVRVRGERAGDGEDQGQDDQRGAAHDALSLQIRRAVTTMGLSRGLAGWNRWRLCVAATGSGNAIRYQKSALTAPARLSDRARGAC